MAQSASPDHTAQLQRLMQQAGFSSLKALSEKAGVSQLQLIRLRRGLAVQTRVDILLKISSALGISLTELLAAFSDVAPAPSEDAALLQECRRLQAQLELQRESLLQEFVLSSVQVLESWMLQWPTAARAAQQKSDLPAARLLPLVRPVEQLLQQWGVEALVPVGEKVPYDPQWHQLMEGTAQPGEPVLVRYTGYRQGDKLLFRARVSPLKGEEKSNKK
ncbi:helix-turn-helix domain-containing protein [Kamptonema formosum]|uniref:helix-turn-helix domain-containing protein n=1 Tax=Kamptonema formosum TaxID=331992 RepID=UPI00034C3AE0|nr:helix-turn-helix domain-containing protein [Oscillatoria sp. PCC 10802]